jgi:hypothetical protein
MTLMELHQVQQLTEIMMRTFELSTKILGVTTIKQRDIETIL